MSSDDSSYHSSYNFKEGFNSVDRDSLFLPHAKIILIGEPAVGKSSIILNFIENDFKNNMQATCGVDFNVKTMKLDEKNELKLQIWDTAGQEKYRSIISNYFKNAHGAVIVFDITNRKSFESIKPVWLECLKKSADEKVCKVVLANKCDKEDEIQVSDKELQKFEKENNIKCFKTSARDNIGINESFNHLAKLMNETYLFITNIEFNRGLTPLPLDMEFAKSIKVSRDKKKEVDYESDECCN